jgi:hypothetical protein
MPASNAIDVVAVTVAVPVCPGATRGPVVLTYVLDSLVELLVASKPCNSHSWVVELRGRKAGKKRGEEKGTQLISGVHSWFLGLPRGRRVCFS